jgi:hypothetical protein
MIEPFEVHIADDVLDDLKARLRRTRLAPDFANDDWEYGTNAAYLRELLAYWETGFDWRAQEREINAFAQFRTMIDDVPVHFIHERGRGPNPMPLIMTHGWPWTFWDLQKVIRPLAPPSPASAFPPRSPSRTSTSSAPPTSGAC